MKQKIKLYLIVGALIAMLFASLVVPAAPFRAITGIAMILVLYLLSRQMRTPQRPPRKKEMIILSEDEVQYKTREKVEPAASGAAADGAANKAGGETSRAGKAGESNTKTGSKATSEPLKVQTDVIEVENVSNENRKPSPYKI